MVARQQLLARLLNPILFKKKDQMVIEIPIRNNNPPTFALAVMRKTYLKNITKKKYPDLKVLCKEFKTGMKQDYTVIAESKQLIKLVLNDKVLPVWNSQNNLIKIFYMSDINKFSHYPFSVRLVLEIKQKNLDTIADLVQSLIGLVDRLSAYKMSDKNKEDALRRREELSNVYS